MYGSHLYVVDLKLLCRGGGGGGLFAYSIPEGVCADSFVAIAYHCCV